jgi:hypothetical protein
MSVHPCTFLEAALRCEERAVQNRSHREHAAHDGTCSSWGFYQGPGQSRQREHIGQNVRCQKVRKRLTRLMMGDENGRDFITKEHACETSQPTPVVTATRGGGVQTAHSPGKPLTPCTTCIPSFVLPAAPVSRSRSKCVTLYWCELTTSPSRVRNWVDTTLRK